MYLIGDVQGCYRELQELLDIINYNPARDRLGFVGDLVNRGPESLATLRFIKSRLNPLIVLGNHDLYLLALGYGVLKTQSQHTLHDILNAPDKDDLLEWLRCQPLLIHNDFGVMVHAGIPPQWTIPEAVDYAREVESILQGPSIENILGQLFHDEPRCWNPQLEGVARWRYIMNALTRMRFCTESGKLDLHHKTTTVAPSPQYKPWFEWYQGDSDIFFGHWAALRGECHHPQAIALDAGCVYGHGLKGVSLRHSRGKHAMYCIYTTSLSSCFQQI